METLQTKKVVIQQFDSQSEIDAGVSLGDITICFPENGEIYIFQKSEARIQIKAENAAAFRAVFSND